LLSGARNTQLLYIAAKLGLADLLADSPQSSADVARTIGVHPQALHRVMRGLVTIGILAEGEDGRFSLAPLGTQLRQGDPDSLHGWAIVWGELHYGSWGDLLHTVRTGEPAFDHAFGVTYWDYLAQHPELGDHFKRAMSHGTQRVAAAVLEAYDFCRARTIVDVGGGHGAMIAAILKAVPAATGVLYDSASGLAGSQEQLQAAGVAERCELVAGDFFQEVPSGGDVYILAHTLHDWDDERSRAILQQCRRAMREWSKLLVIERLLPERAEQAPHDIYLDLQMLVTVCGRERTKAEYQLLLSSAGFAPVGIISTPCEVSILEAAPTPA